MSAKHYEKFENEKKKDGNEINKKNTKVVGYLNWGNVLYPIK